MGENRKKMATANTLRYNKVHMGNPFELAVNK